VFPNDRQLAAVVVALTQPGARLLHDGQLEGRRVHLPVFLGRAPDEASDPELERGYRAILGVLRRPAFRTGRWQLCERSGWPGNESWTQLVAWCWEDPSPEGADRWLVIVNLGDETASGQVKVPPSWETLRGETIRLIDPVHETAFDRSGDDLLDGFYVQLDPWGSHLFSIRPAARGLDREEEE
jgi:hypothetical protein